MVSLLDRAEGTGPVLAISRFVLRHKGAVVVFWLAVLVAGRAASAKLSSRLSPQFALPGAASYQANQQILRLYGNGGNGNPEVALVRLPPGRNAASPAMPPPPAQPAAHATAGRLTAKPARRERGARE